MVFPIGKPVVNCHRKIKYKIGNITVENLESKIKNEGIQMESFHEYSLIMKLSPGQVQSSAASDS